MDNGDLRQELEALIMLTVPKMLFLATVESVNTDKGTCKVKPVDGRAPYTGVQLRPLTDGGGTGDFEEPAEGSQVVCALIDNGQRAMVVKVSEMTRKRIEADLIEMQAKEMKLAAEQLIEMQAEEMKLTAEELIEMNGGQNGGLVKVGALVSRLNAVETVLNGFIAIFNSHTHVATSIGAPTAMPLPLQVSTATTTTQVQLENTKVKH